MKTELIPRVSVSAVSTPLRLLLFFALLFLFTLPLSAQDPSARGADSQSQYGGMIGRPNEVSITIGVRDSRGFPLEDKASVRLFSRMRAVNRTFFTDQNSTANFSNLLEGQYDVEVLCPGYLPVIDHLDVTSGSSFFTAYVYLHSASDSNPTERPSKALVLTPKLANEIDKGLAAMRKRQFDSAKSHFAKAAHIVPESSDVAYLQGTAEQASHQTSAARQDFQRAVTLDPSNDKALLALGELQLQSGEIPEAISSLNKAYAANGAGWRTLYLLAAAYAKAGDFADAETHAVRAVRFAPANSANSLLLLGDIQAAQGKWPQAKQTWARVQVECPTCSEVADARKKIEDAAAQQTAAFANSAGTPSHFAPQTELPSNVESLPWAPPDIDSVEYPVAPNITCSAGDILPRAMRRMASQLDNLEKFAATEHIEHQEIDKSGRLGPVKMRDFDYLVFVLPSQNGSLFLEENRNGTTGVSEFPTSLATTGLNSIGVNVLLPIYRSGYNYQCEGLASVRGEAAWQVRFEEKKGANLDVRRWQRLGTFYNIPLKGRIWVSSTNFNLLKVETDLREPVAELELSRDHLQINYGPVSFADGRSTLWLPWSAEMYLELHGKRYHHRHFLSNYFLFAVDSADKVAPPKNVPPGDDTPHL
jgi:tetratricopeptide (TPR) repeat protein